VLCSSWTPLNQILECQEHLLAGKTISTFSKRFKKTPNWILHAQAQEYAVVISTKYKDPLRWADCVDMFIHMVKQINWLHILSVTEIVELAQLVRENAVSDRIDSVWLVNHHVDLGIYWTVCDSTMPDSWWREERQLVEFYDSI